MNIPYIKPIINPDIPNIIFLRWIFLTWILISPPFDLHFSKPDGRGRGTGANRPWPYHQLNEFQDPKMELLWHMLCFGGISPYTLHRSYIWYPRFSHQWSLTSSKAKSSFKTPTSSSLLNITVVNHQWPLFSCVELPKGTLVHRWKPQIRFGFREKGKYQDQTRKIFRQDILKTSSCFLFPPCRVNNHIPIGMHHQLQMTRLSHS